MSLYSLSYVVFFLLLWLGNRMVGRSSYRVFLFLGASYLFYALLSPYFLSLLVASSLLNHFWGRLVRRHSHSIVLWTGIALNLALWVIAKHGLVLWISDLTAAPASLLVPIGVSFYTFQAIGYLIDVYRGYEGDPSWSESFLFLSFWPVILAGPICRLPEMLPQFRRPEFTPAGGKEGLHRIITGLFMKLVLADTMARGVLPGTGIDFGFDGMQAGWSSLDVWVLCVGYGFQIFFDFAGYTHIAIGSALLFGIRLRENFNEPYRATTITEFWTRWHMSLSSWIRDYLFFPLATARPGLPWRSLCLILSMVVFGLWHGFQLHFLLWGLFHGILLATHRLIQKTGRRRPLSGRVRSQVARMASWLLTFHLVTFSWILFRGNNWEQIQGMLAGLTRVGLGLSLEAEFVRLVVVILILYLVWPVLRGALESSRWSALEQRITWWLAPAVHITMLLLIIIWSEQGSPFVYVRF